jgi:lysophospholipase L1-like esterase
MKLVRIMMFLALSVTSSSIEAQMQKTKVKFLALGDSYTIGESVLPTERWPLQLVKSLRAKSIEISDAQVIAATGWRTDNLKNAIENANLSSDYTLVSLLIGVNDYYQGESVKTYRQHVKELLTMAIALTGNHKNRVFVVSIPDYGYTPFGKNDQPTISSGIDAFNKVNRTVAEEMGVAWFDITPISRLGLQQPDLIASDGLHPSGKMYAKWVELILKGITITENGVVTKSNNHTQY